MLKVIKNEREYEDALERAYNLMQMNLADNSPELDELEALSLFIEYYEDKHYPIAVPSPIDAITFRLEQLGKDKSELAKILGTRARQSEILSGKRKLSLGMIRKLHTVLGIPCRKLNSCLLIESLLVCGQSILFTRMGNDPQKSALNKCQQAHDVKNLLVVDAAPFVSQGDKNVTWTILTASMRTSDYLIKQVKCKSL